MAIDTSIEREKSRGIASHRIVLAGFSQGCAVTLMTGLRHRDRLAGLLCMSGYLPLADKTAAERTLLYQTIAEHLETWLDLASSAEDSSIGQGDHHIPKPYLRPAGLSQIFEVRPSRARSDTTHPAKNADVPRITGKPFTWTLHDSWTDCPTVCCSWG